MTNYYSIFQVLQLKLDRPYEFKFLTFNYGTLFEILLCKANGFKSLGFIFT